LAEPLVLTPQDSGTAQYPITWQAAPGEKVVISGSQPVTGWEKIKSPVPGLPTTSQGHVWVAEVPKDKKFYCLFDQEGYLTRARSPRFETADEMDGVDRYHLRFRPGDLQPLANLTEAELFIRNTNWCVHYLPIASIDFATGLLTTTQPGTYQLDTWFRWEYAPKKISWGYFIENALEYLDEPGEWVLDSTRGKLYFWPKNDQTPEGILRPTVSELISLQGVIEKSSWVRNIRIEGLTFKYADRPTVEEGRI